MDYVKLVALFIRHRTEGYIQYVKRSWQLATSVSVEDCYLKRVVQFSEGADLRVEEWTI